MMCRLLDVSRSRFYAWLPNPLSDRARGDQRLLGLIVAAYTASVGVYGTRRSFLDSRAAGETCRERRGAGIMRVHHRKVFHGYCALRYARGVPALPANTLQRGFIVPSLNHTWLRGITYLCTNLGRLVLPGVVMDCTPAALSTGRSSPR